MCGHLVGHKFNNIISECCFLGFGKFKPIDTIMFSWEFMDKSDIILVDN